ncbi:unnamed protein product [Didymodactylos carnosus]|uniref:Nucleolar protein 16 n=2 Tax=Didymodactylos carnosus TaxID=1234261 RepID=A0A8S2EHG5_9BILA|nr:unnamed protein product [Didymodactylos carnosus]CAF3977442.1 unnamed protein product [Didymodactylos carnosus]
MGKVHRRKMAQKFLYHVNRKKLWQKEKQKRLVRVQNCTLIRDNWDDKLSVMNNYAEFSLVHDVNKAFPIPKTKQLIDPNHDKKKIEKKKKVPDKIHIREEMEEDANTERVKSLRISDPNRLFCIYMLEKYGTNYLAMSKDHRNDYQETPKQLERKMKKFMNVKKAYQKYLDEKKAGRDFLSEFGMND